MNRTLHLFDDPRRHPPADALALREGLGIQTLTSLDSHCYYLENLQRAKAMYQQVMLQIAGIESVVSKARFTSGGDGADDLSRCVGAVGAAY